MFHSHAPLIVAVTEAFSGREHVIAFAGDRIRQTSMKFGPVAADACLVHCRKTEAKNLWKKVTGNDCDTVCTYWEYWSGLSYLLSLLPSRRHVAWSNNAFDWDEKAVVRTDHLPDWNITLRCQVSGVVSPWEVRDLYWKVVLESQIERGLLREKISSHSGKEINRRG